jgi:hypothetical protein
MSDITYLARSDYTIIEQAGRRTVLVATGASTYTYQLEELTKLQAQIITIIKTDSAAGEIKIAPSGIDKFKYLGASYDFLYIGLQGQQVTFVGLPDGFYLLSGIVQPVALEPDIGGGWHYHPVADDSYAYSNTSPGLNTWNDVDMSSYLPCAGIRRIKTYARTVSAGGDFYAAPSNSESIGVRVQMTIMVGTSELLPIELALNSAGHFWVAVGNANIDVYIGKPNLYCLGPV